MANFDKLSGTVLQQLPEGRPQIRFPTNYPPTGGRGSVLPTEFERLLRRAKPSDFQRLINKPYIPRDHYLRSGGFKAVAPANGFFQRSGRYLFNRFRTTISKAGKVSAPALFFETLLHGTPTANDGSNDHLLRQIMGMEWDIEASEAAHTAPLETVSGYQVTVTPDFGRVVHRMDQPAPTTRDSYPTRLPSFNVDRWRQAGKNFSQRNAYFKEFYNGVHARTMRERDRNRVALDLTLENFAPRRPTSYDPFDTPAPLAPQQGDYYRYVDGLYQLDYTAWDAAVAAYTAAQQQWSFNQQQDEIAYAEFQRELQQYERDVQDVEFRVARGKTLDQQWQFGLIKDPFAKTKTRRSRNDGGNKDADFLTPQSQDTKTGNRGYRRFLWLINNTFGAYTEALDALNAFVDNLYIDGPQPHYLYDNRTQAFSYSTALEAFFTGRVHLDWDGFIQDIIFMEIEDRAFGLVGQAAADLAIQQKRGSGLMFGPAL